MWLLNLERRGIRWSFFPHKQSLSADIGGIENTDPATDSLIVSHYWVTRRVNLQQLMWSAAGNGCHLKSDSQSRLKMSICLSYLGSTRDIFTT